MARPRAKTEKLSIRLYEGDKERLAAYYPELGYTKAIRELVHRTLRRMDERLNQEALTEINEETLE